jgi:hypothetical protein
MMTFLVAFCICVTLITGAILAIYCADSKKLIGTVVGLITFILSCLTIFSFDDGYGSTAYIPAETLAHNQTQTVFTTDEDTYLADGLYPDGTYLLTVDGKDVLVVWQAVDNATK